MNKAKLAQNLYGRVRLRPVAWRRTTGGTWLPPIDDDWIPVALEPGGLRIQNARTGHSPLLGTDHVHQYVSDPNRNWNGLQHGFLDLNVQLTLSGYNVYTEPRRRRRPQRHISAA